MSSVDAQEAPTVPLLGLLGLIAISQAFRILKDVGFWSALEPAHRLGDVVNLTTAGLYLIGALLLEISSRDRISAEVGLRLTQANPENAPRLSSQARKAMLVLAHDGRIVGCNEAAEVILGRRRNQLIGTIPIFGRTELPSATEASEAESPGETAVC